jgi:hypothetical protein
VLLVDADTYGGAVAQTLGFLEDTPGLAWAARLAGRGELDAPRLWHATRLAAPGAPRVLTGLPRAGLWTEVRAGTWGFCQGLIFFSCLRTEEDAWTTAWRASRAATRIPSSSSTP